MNLSPQDKEFCSKARFKKEIANYLGVSVQTLNSWLIDIITIDKKRGKLYKPKEVQEILKECL